MDTKKYIRKWLRCCQYLSKNAHAKHLSSSTFLWLNPTAPNKFLDTKDQPPILRLKKKLIINKNKSNLKYTFTAINILHLKLQLKKNSKLASFEFRYNLNVSILLQFSLPQLCLSRDEDATTVDSDCSGRSFLKPTCLNNLFKMAYWSYSLNLNQQKSRCFNQWTERSLWSSDFRCRISDFRCEISEWNDAPAQPHRNFPDGGAVM